MNRYTFDPDGDVLFTLEATEMDFFKINSCLSLDERRRKRKRNLETEEGSQTCEMLVSSKHLMLHSAVFRAMLQPKFAEGAALQKNGTTGHITIPLFDDDPSAMAVIMTIIHCQLTKVPTHISLPRLTHIAVIVDKYEMKDGIDYFAQMWIKGMKEHQFPKNANYPNPCSQLRPWLCISWVFKMSNLFKEATELAILHSNSTNLEKGEEDEGYQYLEYPEDLPIPQAIFEKIEHARIHGITKALAVLDKYIQLYQDSRHTCCSGGKEPPKRWLTHTEDLSAKICDCATYGGLIKSACLRKLYPAPPPPFARWTYNRIADEIQHVGSAVPSYCQELYNTSDGDYGSKDSCHELGLNFKYLLQRVTEEPEMQGLDLESVLSKS